MKNDKMSKLTVNHQFYIRSVIDTCLQTLQILVIGIPIVWILISIMLGLIQSQEATGTTGISTSDPELTGVFFFGVLLIIVLIAFIVYFFSAISHLRSIHKKITELEHEFLDDTIKQSED